MSRTEITLALTGASGAPVALRLLQQLLQADCSVHLLLSDAARVVLATEAGLVLRKSRDAVVKTLRQACAVPAQGGLHYYAERDWMSPVASGSACPATMIVCPCSTGTLAAIASGASDNLIERAADVIIKENKRLVLVPRESPLSAIHLENMLKLARLGVTILPACPGYYHQPESIADLVDFVVARILDQIGIPQDLVGRWGYAGEDSAD